jgi:hypothetical protein
MRAAVRLTLPALFALGLAACGSEAPSSPAAPATAPAPVTAAPATAPLDTAALRERFRVVGVPQASGFSSAAGSSPGSARPRQATVGRDGVINVEAVVVESRADRAD